MKKYFVTGLIILLPVALTLAIVVFLFNLLTEPFAGIVKAFLTHYNLLNNGFLFLSPDQAQKYISQVIILILLFFVTVGLGFIARWFFIHYLIRVWGYVLQRIPFIGSVYKTCQDVIQTLFQSDGNAFKQVVLVPFPSLTSSTIGFVTQNNILGFDDASENLVAVFVPTTPNPTSGFLMIFKASEVVYLDVKPEEALKYVISCGVIAPPFVKMESQSPASLTEIITTIISEDKKEPPITE